MRFDRVTVIICLFFSLTRSPGQISHDFLKTFQTQVTIETGKDHYLCREPVWIRIDIRNMQSAGPNLVGQSLHAFFHIQDANGFEFEPQAMHPSSYPLRRMKSGERISKKINVIRNFFKLGRRHPYLPPGKYGIVFQWREKGYHPVSSNIIHIEISDPQNLEKKAFELINAGDNHFRLHEISKSDEQYLKLVQRYPGSVYAPQALELVLRNHAGSFGKKIKK
jgi:hypothetical protein